MLYFIISQKSDFTSVWNTLFHWKTVYFRNNTDIEYLNFKCAY